MASLDGKIATAHTVCQVCQIHCTLLAHVANDDVVRIVGDKDDPAYRGYSCIKGREVAAVRHLPSRLTHSLKRLPDGRHVPIGSTAVAGEIAARLKAIIDRHGPRSVALFIGTYGYCNLGAHAFALALMRAIGSPMIFTPHTIDQPGKPVAAGLHGIWLAGPPPLEAWDALLLIGTNPVVSMNGGLGPNPARNLKRAQERGMKLVVVDPRVSESARQADLHLQCRPGEDPAILAGITRELIVQGLIDHEFVRDETEGFDALAAAVMPFTPEMVAARAGVAAGDIRRAAALLGAAPRGAVSAGTGTNMSGESAVSEYLVRVIMTLRGWWLRAGDRRPNPGVLIEPMPPLAASPGPFPAFDLGDAMRTRNLGEMTVGFPTAALADEILLEGPGQIKALIVLGGNPVAAWPDQEKTEAAMRALDLLVCFDPRRGQTAQHAHYVVAPKLQLEVETNSAANEMWGALGGAGWGYDLPYGVACPPLVEPPEGSDVVEEWETIHAIAAAMDLPLGIRSFSILDPARSAAEETTFEPDDVPGPLDVWRSVLKGAPVPYDALRARPGPQTYPADVTIMPRPDGWTGRMMIGAGPIVEDLARIAAADAGAPGDYPFRLICRRLHDIHNSNWHDSPKQRQRRPYNPAFMHPDDLSALRLVSGDRVEIRSARSGICAVVEAAPDVRRGCISMSHGWGRSPGEPEDPLSDGASTARLTFTDRDWDRYSGIPIMSAIPVDVLPQALAVRVAAH